MPGAELNFSNYTSTCFTDCVKLFDENCPKYFAENERQEYIHFLQQNSGDYFVGFYKQSLVAAFGVIMKSKNPRARLSWIMVSRNSQGSGVGRAMMNRLGEIANNANVKTIDIAASHLSEPFFRKFGAEQTGFVIDGWGPGMHRVDMELRNLRC